jgi:hemerythrin superfamily protein
VAAGKTDTGEYEHELLDVLMVHNTKEEAVLYPAIDRCLPEKEAAELIETMKVLPAERYAQCCADHGEDAHA